MPRKQQKQLPLEYTFDHHSAAPVAIEASDPPQDVDATDMIQTLVAANGRLSAQVAACDARAFVEHDRARILELRLQQFQSESKAQALAHESIITDNTSTIRTLVSELVQRNAENARLNRELRAAQLIATQMPLEPIALARIVGQHGSGADRYQCPFFVTMDPAGNIVVSDCGNSQILVLRYQDGTHLRTIGSFGTENGQFDRPADVAFDGNGHLIVCDRDNHRVQVLNYRDGTHVRTIGSKGSGAQQLKYPSGIAVSTDGSVAVHDGSINGRIQIYRLNDGAHIKSCCTQGDGDGQLSGSGFLQFDNDNNIIVSDSINCRIQILKYPDGQHLRTISGEGTLELDTPRGIAFIRTVHSSGMLYVTDGGNHRVQVIDYRTGSHIRNIGSEGSGVGQLNRPFGIAISDDGSIVVCDHNRVQVLPYPDPFANV
jgi:DNA-binding beta-propeller fold protein YncE